MKQKSIQIEINILQLRCGQVRVLAISAYATQTNGPPAFQSTMPTLNEWLNQREPHVMLGPRASAERLLHVISIKVPTLKMGRVALSPPLMGSEGQTKKFLCPSPRIVERLVAG